MLRHRRREGAVRLERVCLRPRRRRAGRRASVLGAHAGQRSESRPADAPGRAREAAAQFVKTIRAPSVSAMPSALRFGDWSAMTPWM